MLENSRFTQAASRPIVCDNQPHPLYLAALAARDEADAARAALKAARRQLKVATRRHELTSGAALLADLVWQFQGDRT